MTSNRARYGAFAAIFIVALAVTLSTLGQESLKLEGDISPVHDPAVIKEKDTYYLFCTGGRNGRGVIPIRTSHDMKTWNTGGFVFDSLPEWTTREIPQAQNAWAPDISFYNGQYHLYYSVSTFGSRNSAIGLATTLTLDPRSPDYKWVDEGMLATSNGAVPRILLRHKFSCDIDMELCPVSNVHTQNQRNRQCRQQEASGISRDWSATEEASLTACVEMATVQP